jgi:hypothetical protein
MFIFPRKKYQEYFVRDGPRGSVGTANGSGWMQEDDFLVYIQHFAKHAKPSKEQPVLLTLDNHGSHLSIEALDFCKTNNIVLLSFPPHTSHKLQPLDRGVFGPFKKAVNNACDSWMLQNPGQTMTIYHIPGIVRVAWPVSVTPSNIMSGFSCTGIVPYNRNIFDKSAYAPSQVTDRAFSATKAVTNTQIDTQAIPSNQRDTQAITDNQLIDNIPRPTTTVGTSGTTGE